MTVTSRSIDNAEFTICENYEVRGQVLPWAFLRFGDTDEERKYVVPMPGYWPTVAVAVSQGIERLKIVGVEYMPFRPFPAEPARPARSSSSDDINRPGPLALHFFGGV